MDYHSPGSQVSGLGSSFPNPTDLSRRLMSTQQAQQEAENESNDESSNITSRSRINSITQTGNPFWGTFSPSPAPRSPVLIQCCCGKDDCQNLDTFLRSISSLEDELRLAAEVGQVLLEKHEVSQRQTEEFQRALEQQCARAEQKVQEYENRIDEISQSERNITLERDEALKNKIILESKVELLSDALESRDVRILESNKELEKHEIYDEYEQLKLEQVETQKSKGRLEAVAMLRESNERNKEIHSSTPNNEANPHLINLIKELLSSNNKLKSEVNEYCDLLSESRNEVSTLQIRIEELETANTTGYPYSASYTQGYFTSPFNRNFPAHVLDDIASVGDSASNAGHIEELADESNIVPGIGARQIHPHMASSILSSSLGQGSYNTFNSMGVDASVHSPVGSVVSSSTKRKGTKGIGHNLKKDKKVSVEYGEQIKPDDVHSEGSIKKRVRSGGLSNSELSYSGESEEERNVEDDENLEKNYGNRLDDVFVKSNKAVQSKKTGGRELKNKVDVRQDAKKKVRTFSSPDFNLSTTQKPGVSLLSAGLKRSTVDNSDVTNKVQEDDEKIQEKKSLGARRGADLKLNIRRPAPTPLNPPKRASSPKLPPTASTSKQHKPTQPSPLAVVHKRLALDKASSLSIKVPQSSNNSPADIPKSKVLSEDLSIPAFKNPKFATLGPKERKHMMEVWRSDVAKEQQQKNLQQVEASGNEAETGIQETSIDNLNGDKIKGKNRSNSPVKEFVEEVLVDEANFSAAEAAALANEVEHGLSTADTKSIHSRRTSTTTHHTTIHVPSIMITSTEESKNAHKPPESPKQQNPYQHLFNQASSIIDRMKDTDLLALNRRLKRTFDILELTNLSNNLIESILTDVEILRERFRWVEDFRINDDMKAPEKGISDGQNKEDLYSFSPGDFLPLVHLIQDLLSEIGKLRMMVNDVQVSYVQKVEESRRKAEEEFDKSILNEMNDDEILERRERNRRNTQSNDEGFGAYLSRVFGGADKGKVQRPPNTRHHTRRLSVDFSHECDVSVDSIDTFSEDNYYIDRNLDSFTNTPTMLRVSKRRESDASAVSFLRQLFVGKNNSFNNESKEKPGSTLETSKTKQGTPGRVNNSNSFLSRHPRRIASVDNVIHTGSGEAPTSQSTAVPSLPVATMNPRQLRLSTSTNNLTSRLRHHLASSSTPNNADSGRESGGDINDREKENSIWDKIFWPN
ncbi:4972_t:CDS:2 [Diversispora eburnea]|uniref:4972_t:CDS:1 n=3 Tax=Diversisporales TaxID=214509 RepID=A0A9N8YU71_9GLOM|nr:4972_t:CDS:2 [Diversispora eburnea]